MSEPTPARGNSDVNAVRSGRRRFLAAGLGLFIAGCTKTGATSRTLPGPSWDLSGPTRYEPPEPEVRPPAPAPVSVPSGVRSRSRWARGNPVPSLMNTMLPVRYITVHHDGMRPFRGRDGAARLEAIRRAHRSLNWGDIGYHYAIDRAGTVWECRPIRYQGAHVKDHNPGNIGIVVLGNFDEQQPTEAQVNGVRTHVNTLMRTYGVPVSRLRTHQEWAATRCPGRSLQRYMASARSNGVMG